MTALLAAVPPRTAADDAPDPGTIATVLHLEVPPPEEPAPLGALSRVRGGTYSSTVELIRFADGTTARTDLIRLNPNINGYSLNFHGVSPRQLSHYREASWDVAPMRAHVRRDEITRVLAHGFPLVSTAELSRRLRAAGYPLNGTELREHEAIAATQAAIWKFSNGLELDTTRLGRPVAARARIGEHPSARSIVTTDSALDWQTVLPAGETAYLEIQLNSRPQLSSFSFVLGARAGRHSFRFALESSEDGVAWRPVSSSSFVAGRPGRRHVRRLGHAATLASASPVSGHQGYRFYRVAVTGEPDRDSFVEVRDVQFEPTASPRFRNSDRVVYLYDLLVALATKTRPRLSLAPEPDTDARRSGPFTVAEDAAVTAEAATIVDAEGYPLPGPVAAGQHFYLRHPSNAPLAVRVSHQPAHVRVLIGSRTPDGAAEFTPVVFLTRAQSARSVDVVVDATPRPHQNHIPNRQEILL